MIEKSSNWWVLFLEGIIQFVLGLLLLFSTDITFFTLVEILGIYWLIRGIVMIVRVCIGREKNWSWTLAGGVLGVIAGILVFRYPLFSGFVLMEFLVLFVAIVGLIQGTISLVEGFSRKSFGEVILGVILWIVCLFLFSNPFSSALAVPIVIGILWVFGGAVLTVTAVAMKK